MREGNEFLRVVKDEMVDQVYVFSGCIKMHENPDALK